MGAVVPGDGKGIGAADQERSADWLGTAVQNRGWHPLLRVNLQVGFRAEGEANVVAIGKRVQRCGRGWKGKGAGSETGRRLQATLLVRWEEGDEEAMAVVTDREAAEVEMA